MTGFWAYHSVHIGEWLRFPKGPLRMRVRLLVGNDAYDLTDN